MHVYLIPIVGPGLAQSLARRKPGVLSGGGKLESSWES